MRCPDTSRGARLWADLHAGLDPAQRVVLQEACRIADRLDRLEAQLQGREWLSLQVGEDVTRVTVVVDRALSESRQQALALRALIAELRQAAKRPAAVSKPGKVGGLGDLTSRIAARRDATAG